MINDFITQVKTRGLARINRYEVIIPFPDAGTDSRLVGLFCESTSLPGFNIATAQSRIYGELREMPYERMFEAITLSFYVDSDMEVKGAFEKWMHSIVDQNTRSVEYYDNYVRPIFIYVKNVDDSSPYVLTLHEAYPKTMQSVQMDAAGRDVMKVSVTIQYRYWTSTLSEQVRTKPANIVVLQDPLGVITGDGYSSDDFAWAEEELFNGTGSF